MIICLIGIPKFIFSLRKIFHTIKQFLKSIIKKPIVINVPVFIYLLVIILKLWLVILKFTGKKNEKQLSSEILNKNSFPKEIQKNLFSHPYSTLTTMILLLFGIYSIIKNDKITQMSKKVFLIVAKQMKIFGKYFSITIPTPLSLLILLFINILFQLISTINVNVTNLFTSPLLTLYIIIGLGLYICYRYFMATSKFDLNLTGNIYLNDVSKLNETEIYSLFYPRTINDIEYLISKAKSQGKTISMRGQAHTMGGQTLPSRRNKNKNYVCDLKYMNHVEYNEPTEEVSVEAGATWTQVIHTLNLYGRSPVIMQSYCTFSVAGTISVNAHGITSDDAMIESVISIEYIDMNGKRGECSRQKQSELFSLLVGGYGLFGIITRLRLKTVANVKTSLEYIRLQSDQFSKYYEEFLNDSTIEIKIARVDLVRPNNILLFIFRQESGTFGTVANLSDEARVMNARQHLIYTYVAQYSAFARLRFALEKMFARPLDLTYSSDRNVTMYESAKPMALLYQPLTYYDDTFVLQEYFIPKQNFQQWYDKLKDILKRKYEYVYLLNLTIRFVKRDQLTLLSYTKRHDSYAFVFYFRIKRNELGDNEVKSIHQTLIQLAFQCQGTFYLPYRQHYTYQQILQAYPMFEEFLEKKTSYDSIGLFSNDWYEYYRPESTVSIMVNQINEVELITNKFSVVEQRRTNSFHKVISNEHLRGKFRKFLRTVFNAEPVHVIFNYVNRAVRNPNNKNDDDIYLEVQNGLKTRQFALIRKIFATLKQFRQLRFQINDMLRQQIIIFKHLGYCGKIRDIVSIGDGGRCINELRQILKIKDGLVYIVNDRQRWTDIIERRTLFPIGRFVPCNFSNLTDVPIPSDSTDLVICYMGLHHLPQDQLHIFFKMIYRILRPNGLFLFREHHATEQLKPLLDVAHMVFNAVTGVDCELERKEIRAFRTIEQWRSCVRQTGFQDTFIYDEQEDDPTDDIMLTFRKPETECINTNDTNEIISNKTYTKVSAYFESNYFRPCEWLVVRILMAFGAYLNHTPFYYFPFMKYISIYWSLSLTEADFAIRKYGIIAALFVSPAFLMSITVGTFLTVAFLQLEFVSFIIRAIPAAQYKDEYEQLIIEKVDDHHEEFNFKESIDERINDIQILKENHLYAIQVPRHHTFTLILKKFALHSIKFNLISISQQNEQIQLELAVNNNNEERLVWVKQRSNMDIIYEFKNPVNPNQTHIILRVTIRNLFSFIRECTRFEADNSLTIIQIYDHFYY
ncbi:unnamed protein product [Rotaria magnacalcarata]|uniref:FAD-binding PCMH-type domain-containing protein n=2 Tax=Rotaria magnacalcarata TaxID=392030 RepID=A0A816AWD7_9BILA|nr:unnamed protein product [Rotaria magnacalcarata]